MPASPCVSDLRDVPGPARDRGDPADARRRIDYDPILPFERDQLTQRYGQGTADQGHRRLRRAPSGAPAGTHRSRPLDDRVSVELHVRRFAARGAPGGRVRVRRWATMPAATRRCSADATGARRCWSQLRERSSGARPRRPREFFETNWSRPALVAGMSGRDSRGGHAVRELRPAAAQARSVVSTGPARRPRPSGTATWTARSARASGPPTEADRRALSAVLRRRAAARSDRLGSEQHRQGEWGPWPPSAKRRSSCSARTG